jgi:glycosyltransferase involved in cell wall biosynthesis
MVRCGRVAAAVNVPETGQGHVVHVITKGDVGGAQTHVADLAAEQVRRGWRVTVAVGSTGDATRLVRERGGDVVIIDHLRRSNDPIRAWRAAREVDELVGRLRPTVLHAHSSNAGVVARLVGRRRRLPTVYTAHGWPFQRGAPLGQRLVSRTLESVASRWWGSVICLTEAERHLAVDLGVVPSQRVHVVALGLPDRPVSRRSSDPIDGSIVMVARFAPPKDQLGLLRVCANLMTEWRLTFVGDGPDAFSVHQEVRRLGLVDRVQFVGEQSDVDPFIASASLVALWSRYEGMPLALLEACRAGAPWIAPDLPGARAIAGDPPQGGFIVADTHELRSTLDRVLRDPALLARVGAAGRRRYESAFTLSAMVDSIEQVYLGSLAAT